MQLIGDFYTSLGVEQNFAQDWSNYHPSIIVVVVNTNASKQTWHDCGHDTKYVYMDVSLVGLSVFGLT
jgi:hypothetical protein